MLFSGTAEQADAALRAMKHVATGGGQRALSDADRAALVGAHATVFRGTGEFRDLASSPDGTWLLITWSTADQWVFVRVFGKRKIVAVSGVTRQFGGGTFPRIAGWCCSS